MSEEKVKVIKSVRRVYLDPRVVVSLEAGQELPKDLYRYRNKLANVGAVKAPVAATKPSPSTKKEK